MPISPLTLQRRFAELGRIRLGAKEGGNGRPLKLAAFRFTSANKRYIDDLAVLYGGQPRAWDNGGKPEFEVFTDTTSIPVIAMKGGLSQWMEFWAAGGCIHRCDGERTADGEPCNTTELVDVGRKRLNPHTEAKPTTRLSLMLPELEAIGAWRMESHGWNAAAEIPAVAELAQFVGDLVPAHLNMIERRSVKDGKTSRFVVPVLDLQIGAARLREIVAEKSGTTTELEGPTQGRAALPAGSSKTTAEPDPYDAFFARVAAAASTDDLIVIWDQGKAAHLLGPAAPQNQRHVDLVAAWKARAHDLKDAATQPAPAQPAAAVPDEDGVVDAEIVPDTAAGPSEDEVWQQILKAGGEQGMSLPDVEDGYNAFSGGLMSAEASAGELQAYLQHLVARQDQAVPA